jgi:hypothetical protein
VVETNLDLQGVKATLMALASKETAMAPIKIAPTITDLLLENSKQRLENSCVIDLATSKTLLFC